MNTSLKLYLAIFFVTLFSSFFTSDAKSTDRSTRIRNTIQAVQHQYAPDRRTAVFDITFKQTKSEVILFGEIDNFATKIKLINALQKKLKKEVVDSIHLLPDSGLGSKTKGIVIVEVGNIRRYPIKDGELVTQALLGTDVSLLKKEKDYYFIQLNDNYLGWIDAASLSITDQAGITVWNISNKLIITALRCTVHVKPESSSEPLCTVVAGCILKSSNRKNGWIRVELANGREGFVLNEHTEDLDAWNKNRMLTGENLEKTARTLLDIPYLWGGTSVNGMDCSGFIKIVYRLNGKELHRDADQQVNQGSNIDPGIEFENLQKGDLLFFCKQTEKGLSKHITHIALSLGKALFIHSSGRVRLGSFDPASSYFEESLLKRFVRARRIIIK